MNLQYVIVNVAFADLSPIVFREDLGHELPVMGLNKACVDSAGFVSVRPDPDRPGRLRATAYGRSVGLDIGADVERDSKILTRLFNVNDCEFAEDSQT